MRNAIGPFAQGRLDEALGLAVGLRSIGAGEMMPQGARCGELLGAESWAIVGQHPAHRDAELTEILDARPQERDGAA